MQEKLAHPEPHTNGTTAKLNWLRAGVLGANDGIISIAGLVIGIASAADSQTAIITAGLAGIVAGAISMAAGEYVSVSSSRDTEKALLEKERKELANFPDEELLELAGLYEQRGLTKKTAMQVAKELSAHDAFHAHATTELGINPHELTSPWHAAIASATSFLIGAMIPLTAIILPSATLRIPSAFISVIIALILTGTISAKIGGAHVISAVIRVVLGGVFAMAVTYFIGRVFQVSGI